MIDSELKYICDTAKEAGLTILSYFAQTNMRIDTKLDKSPVTQADRSANDHIMYALKKKFTKVPILSEESEIPDYKERQLWTEFFLVDPLDGTKEFIAGRDEFTVNIAWIQNGEPILGVIYVPVKDTLYFSRKAQGSWKQIKDQDPKRIYSNLVSQEQAKVVTHSRSHPNEKTKKYLQSLDQAKSLAIGSSLKFCLVAEGAADLYPRFGQAMEWDVAAGDCIYRNSAPQGQHASPFQYNTPDLKVEGFILGLELES